MLLKQARINGIRICLFKTKKMGAFSYTITKYNIDGAVKERSESRFKETAHYLFDEMIREENKVFSNKIHKDAIDVKNAIR